MALLGRIAEKIAEGRDMLVPRDWKGEELASWLEAGILHPAGYATEDYVCVGCTACDAFPRPRQKRGAGGEAAFYIRCAQTGALVDIPSDPMAKYAIDVEAFVSLIALSLDCQTPRASGESYGVWDFGESGEAFANHKRRVWFFRRFDCSAARLFDSMPGGAKGDIVVAAKVSLDYDKAAFPFVFCASELLPDGKPVVSLEPMRLRFKAESGRRSRDKKQLRPRDADVEDNLKALAQYCKHNALALARMMKYNRHKAETAVKGITQRTAAEVIGVSAPRVNAYLKSSDYENSAWAKAARFWWIVCTDLHQLEIVADIIRTKLHHKQPTIDRMDALALYTEVLPHFIERCRQLGLTSRCSFTGSRSHARRGEIW